MGPEIRPARNRMSVLGREGEDGAKSQVLAGPQLLLAWLRPKSPSLASQLPSTLALRHQQSSQCRGLVVCLLCAASFSCSWPPTALRRPVVLGAGLSTSSASRDHSWHCLGLEFHFGAIMEVRGRGGGQLCPGSLRALEGLLLGGEWICQCQPVSKVGPDWRDSAQA